MFGTEPRNRMAAGASLCLALTILPACTARAGHGILRGPEAATVVPPTQALSLPQPPPAPAPVTAPAPVPYVTYRPVNRLLAPKTLTLSSYAGANYPSTAPGAAVTPTEFRILTGRPRPRRAWFGLGAGR